MVRLILIVLLGLIVAIGVVAFFLRPEPPRIPRDRDHVVSDTEKKCLSCHGPGEKNARNPKHPLANDCFRCHTWSQSS